MNDELSHLERCLLNDFQRGFPLSARPFAVIAARLGVAENDVIATLGALRDKGMVSRVGPVFRPGRLGASVLAAMAVPRERLEAVATLVNSYPQVNHNYEREHTVNLWFVLTAENPPALAALLDEIARRAGLPVLRLPMLADYHIDLGFALKWGDDEDDEEEEEEEEKKQDQGDDEDDDEEEDDDEDDEEPWQAGAACTDLIAAIQDGLPLLARPYAAIAARVGASEARVCARLRSLLANGTIKRLGVIVRHHELGYRANAMVVWDVAEERVDTLGKRIARLGFVTLCYRRARDLPAWPYNLYCMIHGRDRRAVLRRVAQLIGTCGAQGVPYTVLFSRRRFKQCGARYYAQPPTAMRAAAGGDD